jgi:o-succinylbenzoate synthase
VKLEGVELQRITMPLVAPFRTSFGTEHDRQVVLVHIVTESAEGWGECVAMTEPLYSSEYVDAAADVIRRFLVPALGAVRDVEVHAAERAFARIKGHPMAKAAVEAALLDAQLRQAGMSLGTFLGAVHEAVPAGVSVGIMDSVPELLDAVDGYLAEGYLRIKLKIEPGWDVAPVRAVRERFGDDLLLQVDANTAYTLADARQLAKLDPFDLLLIEQPLAEEDLAGHAQLARLLRTPICLDESITSARAAAEAIRIGATRIVNIKPGRVGGYLEARRIHDVCAANGVPVWWHARDGYRTGGEHRPGRTAQLHSPRRHVRVESLLPARHHHAGRARGRSRAGTRRRRHRRPARPGRTRRRHCFHRVAAQLARPS